MCPHPPYVVVDAVRYEDESLVGVELALSRCKGQLVLAGTERRVDRPVELVDIAGHVSQVDVGMAALTQVKVLNGARQRAISPVT